MLLEKILRIEDLLLKTMKLRTAVVNTLRSRRFWIWQLCGAIIYGIPVAIRFATGNVYLPILGLLEIHWIDHYVPGNLVEKILVAAFFPGGAGGVAGEVFFSKYRNAIPERRQKYAARLAGAIAETAAWSSFQLWGNLQNIQGPYGGNIFEYPMVFPLNFLLASFSIFTPDFLHFAKSWLSHIHSKPAQKNFGNQLLSIKKIRQRLNYLFSLKIGHVIPC